MQPATGPYTPRPYSVTRISRIEILAAQSFIMWSTVVALVCSAWTLSEYVSDSKPLQAYSWVGTIASGMLLAGLCIEGIIYKRGGCLPGCIRADTHIERARQRGLGLTMTHIATSSISMFSTCAAAVNIYNNAEGGLYAISCAVIAFYWIYGVLFTPNTVMHVAIHTSLPEAEQVLIGLHQNTGRLVWRNSKVDPSAYTN
jgi:hypothetical protein